MEINVSVQNNGGLLPDIILLTQCSYIGEPISYHEEPMFPPKPLGIIPPAQGGCSEGLDAFRFFLNNHNNRCIQIPFKILYCTAVKSSIICWYLQQEGLSIEIMSGRNAP